MCQGDGNVWEKWPHACSVEQAHLVSCLDPQQGHLGCAGAGGSPFSKASSLYQVTAYRLFRISACTALEGVLVERTELGRKERANADCHRRHRHLRIIPWFGLPISEGFSRTERATVRIVLTHAHRGLVQEKFRVEENFSVQVATPHASASHTECS
jgi:hypothetical protein